MWQWYELAVIRFDLANSLKFFQSLRIGPDLSISANNKANKSKILLGIFWAILVADPDIVTVQSGFAFFGSVIVSLTLSYTKYWYIV